MPEPLTPIERNVYHYLIDFLAENTYQPSVREIGRRFQIKSTKTVADILRSLALKGYVQRQGGRSRGLRLVGYSALGGTQPVPLYSRLNATEPVVDEGNRERFVAMERVFVPTDDAFFVRVADDAMAARGLRAGDLVLVNPAARAHDGEPVVARVGPAVLVRLVEHHGPVVELTAPDAGHMPIRLGPADDFAIVGTVAGVVRPTE